MGAVTPVPPSDSIFLGKNRENDFRTYSLHVTPVGKGGKPRHLVPFRRFALPATLGLDAGGIPLKIAVL
jgi:hypothetical protein